MTIDEAYRLVQSICNKDQRGYIKPSQFNLWATIAQIEAISDRLTNVKRIDGRLVPQYGYKIDAKIKNELRELIVGPAALPLTSGQADYPDDYFYTDSIQTSSYIPIDIIDTDQYAHVKQSAIYPPDELHPVSVFYGSKIKIDPSATSVIWTYLKYPVNPNWDYVVPDTSPVYTTPTGLAYLVLNYNFINTKSPWISAGGGGINFIYYNNSVRAEFSTTGALSTSILYQDCACIVGDTIRIKITCFVDSNITTPSLNFYFLNSINAGIGVEEFQLSPGVNKIDFFVVVPVGAVRISLQMFGTITSGTPYFEVTEFKSMGFANVANSYFGETGKPSQDFQVDRSLHTEICWRICKYAGINIDMNSVIQLSLAQEASGV